MVDDIQNSPSSIADDTEQPTGSDVVNTDDRTALTEPAETPIDEIQTAETAAQPSVSEVVDCLRPVFDTAYYAQQLDELERNEIEDLVTHYVVTGWQRRLDPSPDFSTGFYLDRSPDVRRLGFNPFYHYIRWGRAEGRFANAGAARAAKLTVVPPDSVEAVVRSAFDSYYYFQQRPALADNFVDPVKHYIAYGWREGLDPTPFFSTSYYLERSPDVRKNGVNPFFHYIRWGKAEGRRSKPEGDLESIEYGIEPKETEAERTVRAHFDAEYYCAQLPAVRENHVDPLKHYLAFGWRQGFDPAPGFSVSFYLSRDAALRGANQEPYFHYLTIGKAQGRLPKNPVMDSQETNLLTSDAVRRRIEVEFDVAFYLDQYPDIKRGRLDPVAHYIHHGWREGRDPAPWFSTAYYLSTYPDVRTIEVNPFYHYLVWGRQLGLAPYATYHKINPRMAEAAPGEMVNNTLGALLYRDAPLEPTNRQFDPKQLSIHWLIPDFSPGGGGHMTIFRMIRWLEFFGHRCTVWINNPRPDVDATARYETIVKYYQTISAPVRPLQRGQVPEEEADIVVATSWDTAYTATAMANVKQRFYFVQDYEPLFFPRGSFALAAEYTYQRDLACICASPWLEQIMRERHGAWARKFWLAPDRYVYRPPVGERPVNAIPRIAFYSRVGTARRAVELGLMALQDLHDRGVSFQVDLFGDESLPRAVTFPYINHGVLDAQRLAELYGVCDIGLCFSSTNYSLVPLEMMACGLPVVELDGESTRAIFPPETVRLCGPHPTNIADALEQLLADENARKTQAKAASAWVESFSWESSARQVEHAFIDKLTEENFSTVARPSVVTRSQPKASVVIPTYNGGPLFQTVLDAVQKQRAPWPFEIIIIDSQSTDGTAEFCRTQDLTVFREIPKGEFQHGRTRNLGISLSHGEYVALLTQDALPVNEFWLYNFVTLLDKYPRAAGGFGRHIAYPQMSPFVRRDIEDHFKQYDNQPIAVSKYTDLQRWNEPGVRWKQFLHYFSDNNACLRREAWNRIPYPEIDYGEDQLWALQIIRAGYQKVYAPSAVVYHSHDYDEAEQKERAKVEADFFKRYFDYDLADFDFASELPRLNSSDLRWAVRNGVSQSDIETKYKLNAARLLGYLEALK